MPIALSARPRLVYPAGRLRAPTESFAACAQSLNLESNRISTSGIEALAAALPSNTSLRELKLANQSGQPYSQHAEEALAAALESNLSLTKLTLEM